MSNTSVQRVARLLTLVPWLRMNDGVTLDEAARHFDVDRDQIERDLWQIILCGFPGYGPDQLVDIDFWDDDRIHVIDALALSTPMRLTSQEALTLLAGLSILRDTPGVGEHGLIVQTIADIESALASQVGGITWESDVDANVRSVIDEALRSQTSVTFTYLGVSSDSVSYRHVIPESIEARLGRVYLHGWDLDAHDHRIFRMDRVVSPVLGTSAQVTGARVERPREHAVIAGDSSSTWLLDRLGPDHYVIQEDSWEAKVPYADSRWLVREIMGAGGSAWVVSPMALRREVAKAAEDLLARYALGHEPLSS